MSKILLADDDSHNINLLKDFLEVKGYTVITAFNGKEAVDKVEEKPDLVLLDIQMPVMNGLRALKIIKEQDPSIGVVMVTGMDEEEIAWACIKNGANEYITKPFNLDHLARVIEDYLEQNILEEAPADNIEKLTKDDLTPEAGEAYANEDKEKESILGKRRRIEKRKCRRFKIQGASGKVKKIGFLYILKGFSKTYPILDISKGGASITCSESLRVNQKIIFQLLVPQEPVLILRAKITWVGHSKMNGGRTYALQFMSYGKGPDQNPLDALKFLRKLDEKYN